MREELLPGTRPTKMAAWVRRQCNAGDAVILHVAFEIAGDQYSVDLSPNTQLALIYRNHEPMDLLGAEDWGYWDEQAQRIRDRYRHT